MSSLNIATPLESTPEFNDTTNIDSIVYSINNLLITSFKEHNITIYGTWEEPLFKAKEIGDMLGIKKIRTSLENMDEECKVLRKDHMTGGRSQYFLTEVGLYKLLFRSKKSNAEEFYHFICELLKSKRDTTEEIEEINTASSNLYSMLSRWLEIKKIIIKLGIILKMKNQTSSKIWSILNLKVINKEKRQ